MKHFWFIFLWGCTGCVNILGSQAQEKSLVIRDYTKGTFINQSLFQSALRYNEEQRGKLNKSIVLSIYSRTDNLWGRAEINGTKISLYYLQSDADQDQLQTLFHELDHLRGFRHHQMPSEEFYMTMAGDFLKNYRRVVK